MSVPLFAVSGGNRSQADFSGNEADFPRKPIRIVVPFSAGSASDRFARIVQSVVRRGSLSAEPLEVINVPGAGGTVGSRQVRYAAPDGYHLLLLHDGMFIAKHSGQTPFGAESFVPVAATGASYTVVCGGPKSKWTELDEVLAEAVEAPDSIRFGFNPGSPSHFVAARLERAKPGARFRMMLSGGGRSRFLGLVAGELDLTIFSTAEYLRFRGGGLRAIAYLGEQRHGILRAIPTAKERGIDLVTGTTQYWWAPPGTPRDRVDILATILEQAMQTEDMRKELKRISVAPFFLRGDELTKHVARQEAKYAAAGLGRPQVALPYARVCLAGAALFAVLGLASWFWRRPRLAVASRLPWLGLAMIGYVSAAGFRVVPFWLVTGLFCSVVAWLLGSSRRQRVACGVFGWLLAAGVQVLFSRVLIIGLP